MPIPISVRISAGIRDLRADEPGRDWHRIERDATSSPNIIDLTGQGAPVAVASPANAAPLVAFSLSQSSLTFATTTVGNISAPQTVKLTNTGTITIHVSVVASAADFTAQNSCARVVAGAACAIIATATPQFAGTRIAHS